MTGAAEVRPKSGDLIAGRYRLHEQVGEGAAAFVFRAVDEALGRDVAVKILRGALAASPAAAARFRAEGRAAAIIAHPNVAAVFDVAPEREAPAIIMEFVDGEDLASMLRRVGPLVPRRAAAIAAQVARGLAAAHQRGIIHRDVSSRNILIGREGRAQITDFGIAHATLEEGVPTAPAIGSAPIGTVHYVAPEVAAGGAATTSSDLYGLGVVLFELLTGRRPADSGTTETAPSPRTLRPDVPVELETITMQLLAANPKQRTANATAAADALESYVVRAGRTSIQPRAVGPAAGAPRALAGTRVSRVAGEAGPGEPSAPVDPNDEWVGEGEPEAMSLRSTLLTIGGVSLAVVVLLASVIFGLRLINAGGGPDANVKVPPIASLTLSEAIPIVEQLGLRIKVVERVRSESLPVDTILSQSPEATTLVPTGSVIEVRVVVGSGLAVVPDLIGATEEEAAKRLKSANLRLGQVISAWSTDAPSGSIVQQNPRAGLQIANGSSVDLVISLGPEPSPTASASPSGAADTAVPILRCMPVGEAALALEAVGLALDPGSAGIDPTEIVDLIAPAAGVLVPSGSSVQIVATSPFGTPLAGCP
ncbi:MAG: serine/threonine-protein kinase [Chloroflexi bacterium]|nr:MAG: serine/threonine-protein kinase [Chloroflexota bacterium]